MKRIYVFAAAGLLCGVLSSALFAAKRQELIFEPGAGIQLGEPEVTNLNTNVDGIDDASAFLGAQYLWNASEALGFGLDVNFLGDASASRRLVSGAPTAWQTQSLVIMSLARYYVAKTFIGNPYVLLGLGAHRTTLLADDNLVTIINSSRWGFASALGVGLDFPVRDPFLVGVEGRLQYLSKTHYTLLDSAQGTTLATGGSVNPSSFDILLRVGIRF